MPLSPSVRKRRMLSIVLPGRVTMRVLPHAYDPKKENTTVLSNRTIYSSRKIRSRVWSESERAGQEFRLDMQTVELRALYSRLCPRSVCDLSCRYQSLFFGRLSFCESPQPGLQWWLCFHRLWLGLCLPLLFRLAERDSC